MPDFEFTICETVHSMPSRKALLWDILHMSRKSACMYIQAGPPRTAITRRGKHIILYQTHRCDQLINTFLHSLVTFQRSIFGFILLCCALHQDIPRGKKSRETLSWRCIVLSGGRISTAHARITRAKSHATRWEDGIVDQDFGSCLHRKVDFRYIIQVGR